MNDKDKVYRIVKKTEEKFNVICFAYYDSGYWWICVDNYELYMGGEMKPWFNLCRKTFGKSIKITFCYCNPIEKKLLDLANQDNLILNI